MINVFGVITLVVALSVGPVRAQSYCSPREIVRLQMDMGGSGSPGYSTDSPIKQLVQRSNRYFREGIIDETQGRTQIETEAVRTRAYFDSLTVSPTGDVLLYLHDTSDVEFVAICPNAKASPCSCVLDPRKAASLERMMGWVQSLNLRKSDFLLVGGNIFLSRQEVAGSHFAVCPLFDLRVLKRGK